MDIIAPRVTPGIVRSRPRYGAIQASIRCSTSRRRRTSVLSRKIPTSGTHRQGQHPIAVAAGVEGGWASGEGAMTVHGEVGFRR